MLEWQIVRNNFEALSSSQVEPVFQICCNNPRGVLIDRIQFRIYENCCKFLVGTTNKQAFNTLDKAILDAGLSCQDAHGRSVGILSLLVNNVDIMTVFILLLMHIEPSLTEIKPLLFKHIKLDLEPDIPRLEDKPFSYDVLNNIDGLVFKRELICQEERPSSIYFFPPNVRHTDGGIQTNFPGLLLSDPATYTIDDCLSEQAPSDIGHK